MPSTDRYLSLAKTTIPPFAVAIFALVKVGPQAGPMIIPFLVVAVIAIVQGVRSSGVISGFSSHKELRGSVADTAHRGRSVADQILDER